MNEEVREMPKWKQRKIKKSSHKLAKIYRNKLQSIKNNKTSLPVAALLREMAFEYTHRYASAGVESQPTHFQFFEPFLHIKLIQQVAPYTTIEKENSHIFYLRDFLDYATSELSDGFKIETLLEFPQDEIFNFSISGNIKEVTFINTANREMFISGYSMIRRGSSIHWYLLAGEQFTEEEWHVQIKDQLDFSKDVGFVSPRKKNFLEEAIAENGKYSGQRIQLDGTENAQRVIVCGEFDLFSKKHTSRCVLSEYEKTFVSYTDNLDALEGIPSERKDMYLSSAEEQFQSFSALWSVAEAFLQLPSYFKKSLALNKDTGEQLRKRISKKKGGKGISANYSIIPSLNPKSLNPTSTIEEIQLPQYQIEIEGHWEYIGWDKFGTDRHGNTIIGKTWVHSQTKLKRQNCDNTIYVKDTIESAKLQIEDILQRVERLTSDKHSGHSLEELYIMRCHVMKQNIFKVGFTTKTSEERARELSSATGVPKSFVVLKKWKCQDAQKVETDVQIALLPYRVENSREFFRVKLSIIENTIERVLKTEASKT
ncbi:MAG: GIY-YIG nuclease family protein [Verrucomicrobiota bacterium]